MSGFRAERVVEGPVSLAASIDWPGGFPEKNREEHTSINQYQKCCGNRTYQEFCRRENEDKTSKSEDDERR